MTGGGMDELKTQWKALLVPSNMRKIAFLLISIGACLFALAIWIFSMIYPPLNGSYSTSLVLAYLGSGLILAAVFLILYSFRGNQKASSNRRYGLSNGVISTIVAGVLLFGILLNPLISPIRDYHDSDLDGYADWIDAFPNDREFHHWLHHSAIDYAKSTPNSSSICLTVFSHTIDLSLNETRIIVKDPSGNLILDSSLSEINGTYKEGVMFQNNYPQNSKLWVGDQFFFLHDEIPSGSRFFLTDQNYYVASLVTL